MCHFLCKKTLTTVEVVSEKNKRIYQAIIYLFAILFKSTTFVSLFYWSGARVAEEVRLESVYTPKGYPEFESRSLR